MDATIHRAAPVKFDAEMTFRLPSLGAYVETTEDAGRVRLGGQGPAFRLADAGRVRLGGQGPVFRRPPIADAGRVRLGGQGPLFR